MDAQMPPTTAEVRTTLCHQAPRKEESVKNEKLPLLVAYCADTPGSEALEQLVAMQEDRSTQKPVGQDLPQADRAALLRKAKKALATG